MLIKHICQADPLCRPKCGGAMKIIAIIEAYPGPCGRRMKRMAASPTWSIPTSSNMPAARLFSSERPELPWDA